MNSDRYADQHWQPPAILAAMFAVAAAGWAARAWFEWKDARVTAFANVTDA